jgi:molybdate transport system substrate-binding protein
VEILIAAASDLTPLQRGLADLALRQAGIRARFTFGSSGMLARQIRNGAPYDLYLSANQAFTEELASSGRVRPETLRVYAEGRLGIWSKSGRYRTLESLLAATVRHVAIANPAHAPYGAAAREALVHQGLWSRIESKLVYGENVQQAMEYAISGNADAVLAAWSLMAGRNGVPIPPEWHNPIRQTGAVVTDSRQPGAAGRFLDLLSSPEGQKLLTRAGFAAVKAGPRR